MSSTDSQPQSQPPKKVGSKPLSSLKKKPKEADDDDSGRYQQNANSTTPPYTSSTDSSNSSKRKRVTSDSPTLSSPTISDGIEIVIPDLLKKQLVDDWSFVNNEKSLVSLPRVPSIKSILEDFANQNEELENIHEVMSGIESYFNKAIGLLLMYKFERIQYSEMLKCYPNVPMSEIYGAEHLLRLFVKMPELIQASEMEEKTVLIITKSIEEFIKYLERNISTFFLKEYTPVTSHYTKLV